MVIPERSAGGAERQAGTEVRDELPPVLPGDEVKLASLDSFPASDPPSWTGSIIG
jgi:hypothetical protein